MCGLCGRDEDDLIGDGYCVGCDYDELALAADRLLKSPILIGSHPAAVAAYRELQEMLSKIKWLHEED